MKYYYIQYKSNKFWNGIFYYTLDNLDLAQVYEHTDRSVYYGINSTSDTYGVLIPLVTKSVVVLGK